MIKGLESLSTFLARKVNSAGSCVACLNPNARYGLCAPCKADLPSNRRHCRQCALPLAFSSDQMLCGECIKDPPPFSRVVAPFHYRFPVDRMLQRYKDSEQRAFAKPLLYQLSDTLTETLDAEPSWRPDLLIPAPMHPARRRSRGFNQASDIAEHLSHQLGIPWSATLVVKRSKTRAQRSLDRQARLANLSGVFEVTGAPPNRIALVDDVVTTGATVRQLSSVLKQAGAGDVQVWALARTPG